MRDTVRNLFEALPEPLMHELFEPLLQRTGVTLERIVSLGHATPAGEWYDQERDEWVALLSGSAVLQLEGEEPFALQPGDYLLLPAHCRHRVVATDASQPSVWLALHL